MKIGYFNRLIEKHINALIEEKELLSGEINEVATYIDFTDKDITLDRLEIGVINDKRQQIAAIYKLIEDLEYIKNIGDRW